MLTENKAEKRTGKLAPVREAKSALLVDAKRHKTGAAIANNTHWNGLANRQL
jgi:hypothetical protein